MAETTIGLYKWAHLQARTVAGPRRRRVRHDDLRRLVTHRRLHGEIASDASYTTPVEAEADYYRQTTTAIQDVTQ